MKWHRAWHVTEPFKVLSMPPDPQRLGAGIKGHLITVEGIRAHIRLADVDDQAGVALAPIRQPHLHTHLAANHSHGFMQQLRAGTRPGHQHAFLHAPVSTIALKPLQRRGCGGRLEVFIEHGRIRLRDLCANGQTQEDQAQSEQDADHHQSPRCAGSGAEMENKKGCNEVYCH